MLRPPHCLAASAIILRLLGKTVAIANGCWLITSTLLELIGVYDSCWVSRPSTLQRRMMLMQTVWYSRAGKASRRSLGYHVEDFR